MSSLLVAFTAGQTMAKPLLTNSQSTYASACLNQIDTPARLTEICQFGLEDTGASRAQQIQMLDRLAWAYFDLEDFERASSTFDEIFALNPNAERAQNGHAWLHYKDGDYEAAAELFRKASSQKPTSQNVSGFAASQYRGGEVGIDEFEQHIRTALALNPDDLWAIRELAWVLADEQRYEAAQDLFQSAIERDPEDLNAQHGLAHVYSEQNRWDEAFDHVTRALELNPGSISAISLRSLILLNLGRPKQALIDAEAVIDAWPDDADGYVRKARALSEMGRRGAAHGVLEKGESRAGASSYLLFWRAYMYFEDGDFDEAQSQIRRSVKRADSNHFDHRLQAEIALAQGNLALARAAIDKSLHVAPEESYAQFVNALVLLEEQKFELSEQTFDQAISAGLSTDNLTDFLSALVVHGRFVQAIRVRVRYSD